MPIGKALHNNRKLDEVSDMAAKKKDFFDLLADWMRTHGIHNPREVPDHVVESLRAEAAAE